MEQCLYSVIKGCRNIRAEIFVVDNNSTDGSRQYLEPKFPGIYFKWNKTNAGFAKANNSVLQILTGKLILFLNPDTIVPEDCFEKCIDFFKQHETCGALGVKMIDGAGNFLKESKRSFPSPFASFCKMSGLTGIFPRSKIFARYYAGHLPDNKTNETDVLPGAFFMVDKKVLDTTGGFDEAFFMYGEDIDLSYRVQKAGYKNYYFPGTTIIHFKGESTIKDSPSYNEHFFGAMKLFTGKHFSSNFFLRQTMLFAIALGKQLALFKQKLKKGRKIKMHNEAVSTIVIGSEENFKTIAELTAKSNPPLIISEKLAVSPDADSSIVKEFLKRLSSAGKGISTLLFCEGKLTFKSIIQHVADYGGQYNFLFHANGSSSIVGSADKNKNGVIISN